MSQYLGLFVQQNQIIWPTLSKLCSDSQHWLYISDEQSTEVLMKEKSLDEEVLPNGYFLDSSEFFLREQVVRAKPVITAIADKIESLFPSSTRKINIFIEMTWAVRTPSGDIYLRELQEAFQNYLIGKNITLVCIYNESIMLDEQLILGLFSHPQIVTIEDIKDNPYYLPAPIIRTNQLKSRLNFWLKNVDPDRISLENGQEKSIIDLKESYPIEKPLQTKIAQTKEGRWKIRCFGELRIHRENGELIDWNTKGGATKKLKTLFSFLLLKGEKGATSEELADLLWPDADSTEQALNRLYQAIRFLRVVLDGEYDDGKKSPFLIHQSSIYYLKLPYDSWIDLPMFQELCFKGNQHLILDNLEQAKICYESAERLYSGELFHDIPLKYIENNDNDWCWSKRFWYREMYQKLLYSMARIYRQLGELSTAINYCDKALAEDPNLEAAHREKLITLAAAKRFDALHRQYRIYAESLRKFNLGSPSPEIHTLYLNLSKIN